MRKTGETHLTPFQWSSTKMQAILHLCRRLPILCVWIPGPGMLSEAPCPSEVTRHCLCIAKVLRLSLVEIGDLSCRRQMEKGMQQQGSLGQQMCEDDQLSMLRQASVLCVSLARPRALTNSCHVRQRLELKSLSGDQGQERRGAKYVTAYPQMCGRHHQGRASPPYHGCDW